MFRSVVVLADGKTVATGMVFHRGPLGASQGLVRLFSWP
jgi:hypothetical protein